MSTTTAPAAVAAAAAAPPSPTGTPAAASATEEGDPFLASFGADLVSLPEYKAAGTSKLDFDGLLAHRPLELHEDLKGGCGGQLWPAGMVLSRYLLRKYGYMDGGDDRGLVGKSIVELGAGGGLVGLAVALGCRLHRDDGSETVNEKPASDATRSLSPPLHITDQQPMFDLMVQNTALNGLAARVKPVVFDWGAAPPAEIPLPPDVILAADCVYFEPAFPLLLRALEDLVGERTVCWFCFKKRRRADMHFVKDLKKRFSVDSVVDDPDKEVYGRENIFLLKVTKKKAGAA
ncbi:putative methyltransferase-domain-containing protein [Phyllosticta citrichinensis]